MRRNRLYLIALALVSFAPLRAEDKADERRDAEPPLRMEVEICGKVVAAEAGKAVEVEVDGRRISLRINVLPHRQFDRAGVRFLYPTSHSWEVDRDEPGVTIYTLDGNDTVIMLMKYALPMKPGEAADALITELTETYGRPNVKSAPTTLKADARTLNGTRLVVSLAGETLHQDIFDLDTDGATCLLLLQDTLDDDGNPTAEMEGLRKLLVKTLELGGSGKK